MADFNWSRFMVRINVKASREKLYWRWATKEGIESWFLRKSDYKNSVGTLRGNNEFVQTGDTYSWWWHGYPDDVAEHGEILDCNGKDFFKFKFGGAGNCTVTIYKEQEENIVELLQDEIPTDDIDRKSVV